MKFTYSFLGSKTKNRTRELINFVIRIWVHSPFEDISGISRTIRIFLSLQNFLKTPPSRDTKFSMCTSEKLWLVMSILRSVCYGTLMVLVDHSSPSYRHRMEMIIAVPEWLIKWLIGNLLCAGPNSSNSSLKSRNTPKRLLDGPGCSHNTVNRVVYSSALGWNNPISDFSQYP